MPDTRLLEEKIDYSVDTIDKARVQMQSRYHLFERSVAAFTSSSKELSDIMKNRGGRDTND